MAEFVHLHLHTEFSLLDGACRIDELLDEAVRQKMPAIAVTEHGNMFSSVIFHDHARARGLNPILGCEVYVAPGDRQDRSGVPGATQNHLVLLAENLEGYHNLIKLVSAGYTEGFYYKPRIDKALLASHASGLIGLSSCLKGEVATGLRMDQQRKAMDAAATYRDILGAGNFFLEMQDQGIDELVTAIDRHFRYLERSGTLRERRRARLRERVVEVVEDKTRRRLWSDEATNAWLEERLPALESGQATPFGIADALLSRSADLLTRTTT